MTQVRPPAPAADHLRREEKGTRRPSASSVPVRPPASSSGPGAPSSPSPSRTARAVALDSCEVRAARAPRSSGPAPAPPGPSTRSRRMRPVVMVPVLSRHSVSTRARTSTAGSSWTRTRRRARRSEAVAKLTLVSSTSPWGTMPTTPAMAATVAMRQAPVARAACQPPAALICDQASSSATGTMTQEIQRRTRSVPSWSSEPTLEKRRASRASRWA